MSLPRHTVRTQPADRLLAIVTHKYRFRCKCESIRFVVMTWLHKTHAARVHTPAGYLVLACQRMLAVRVGENRRRSTAGRRLVWPNFGGMLSPGRRSFCIHTATATLPADLNHFAIFDQD